MKASEIAKIIGSTDYSVSLPDERVTQLLTDSRHLTVTDGVIFFAIKTERNSGTRYIDELYEAGVRMFVVPNDYDKELSDANIWHCCDVVEALQAIAAKHREAFAIPVVGITGSNGKTVVKDWVVQMLAQDRRVCASPKSYNSQIGVPLSVWQLTEADAIGIFEAGISKPGEMIRLQKTIRPTIGILTTIGTAHDENFSTQAQKIREKLILFKDCDTVIYSSDQETVSREIKDCEFLNNTALFTWGHGEDCDLRIVDEHIAESQTTLTIRLKGAETFDTTIPFVDHASVEDAMHCISLILLLGYDPATLAERCLHLNPVEMRMELCEAIGNCMLINDSYSLDIHSLEIALDYLCHTTKQSNKTIIISDILQSGLGEMELYTMVAQMVQNHNVDKMIAIGEAISRCKDCFEGIDSYFYESTSDFVERYNFSLFDDEAILLKGARTFAFEKIARLLQLKSHETVMEVNLDALIHNLRYYRTRIKPSTKLMAMVKASSYGAGRVEVAAALQYNNVDYLTVAYTDEGVELRRGGISLPIMVMNPEEASFDDIIRYRLEPDIYSFRILKLFADRVRLYGKVYPIHIEFDTGMHRLGFVGEDVARLQKELDNLRDIVEVKSVFSHLACAEDADMDDFTKKQIDSFKRYSSGLPGIKHILNSSGITRFAEAQMDMVRLGIGLYGISPEDEVQKELQQVSRLTTKISQIKSIASGDTVGYNCRWRATKDSRIAIIPIGYADGLHRNLGNGKGHVIIAGKLCPIIGSICMDMCFVDITDVNECEEGDSVIIFGDGDLLQRNATASDTIAYELLTSISPRVKRVYYHEE